MWQVPDGVEDYGILPDDVEDTPTNRALYGLQDSTTVDSLRTQYGADLVQFVGDFVDEDLTDDLFTCGVA